MPIDAGLVRRLLAAQHPDLAALSVTRFGNGWDNEIFALGDAAVQPWKKDKPVPGIAQGAIQTGSWAAKALQARLDGKDITQVPASRRAELGAHLVGLQCRVDHGVQP